MIDVRHSNDEGHSCDWPRVSSPSTWKAIADRFEVEPCLKWKSRQRELAACP